LKILAMAAKAASGERASTVSAPAAPALCRNIPVIEPETSVCKFAPCRKEPTVPCTPG
jgi:hypothetical protein